MGEKQSYRPEEVLETEGPDKGRVKDVELAQIGAEKDQEYRESRMDEVVMKMGIAPGTNELIDSPRSTKKKEEIADSAERGDGSNVRRIASSSKKRSGIIRNY